MLECQHQPQTHYSLLCPHPLPTHTLILVGRTFWHPLPSEAIAFIRMAPGIWTFFWLFYFSFERSWDTLPFTILKEPSCRLYVLATPWAEKALDLTILGASLNFHFVHTTGFSLSTVTVSLSLTPPTFSVNCVHIQIDRIRL